MFKQHLALSLVFSLVLLAPGIRSAQPATAQTSAAPETNARSALFIENAGQWPGAARFQVWGSPLGAGTTWLAADAIWLTVASGESQFAATDAPVSKFADLQPVNLPPAPLHALNLTFPGSNPDVRIEPFDPLTTTVSYFLGNDPEKWHSNVPVWGGVRYADLYPGVDLVIGESGGDWRLEAARDAATDQVRLQIEGAVVAGIDGHALQLEVNGELMSVTLPAAPFVYQTTGASGTGESLALTAHPDLHDSQLTSPDDDPADLIYSTFLGGVSADWASDIATDSAGNAYLTGLTFSSDFPITPGAFDPVLGGSYDVFAAKLNPSGDALVYSTFLGGGSTESDGAIAVDSTTNAYLTGSTSSSDFPTTPGAFDTSFNGDSDAFVVKLNQTGSALIYSTFLGGTWSESAKGIAVGEMNVAFVTGSTSSPSFPVTPGAFDPSFNGWEDTFVVKLNPAGSALDYATYLGGNLYDIGTDIAVGDLGEAYVTGSTWSDDFPTTPGAFSTSLNGPAWDAFVVKLNPAGAMLSYSTLLGGTGHETPYGSIDVDTMGFAFVSGVTTSVDFPTTPGAYDPTFNGGENDAFVAKLNQSGSALVYATYLGGSGDDSSGDVALDSTGSACVTGVTGSGNFPTTPDAFDTSFNGGTTDAFVVKLNPAGSTLVYSTFLGGNADESGRGVAVETTGNVLLAGGTYSPDFPVTPGAFDPSYNGGINYVGGDAFVTKLDVTQPPAAVTLASLEAASGNTAMPAWLVAVLLGLALATSTTVGWSRRTSGRHSET